ncbi:hypothetical protein [Caenispirillum salinarum]|uniref:hypothetical protein n=1 Tax=Caenispirillum salinarum TaxID=859058 RepID=UPI0002D323A8|nr:hypothetical protein [Caenispirillum salinarum]
MRKTIALGARRDTVEIIQTPAPNQPGRIMWPDGMVTEITFDDMNALAYMAERARISPVAMARAADGAAVERAIRSHQAV